jgi:hypothetical protein
MNPPGGISKSVGCLVTEDGARRNRIVPVRGMLFSGSCVADGEGSTACVVERSYICVSHAFDLRIYGPKYARSN